MEKNYIHRNDIPWFVLTDPVTEKNLSKYNIQYALRLYDSDTINNVVPVYTDGGGFISLRSPERHRLQIYL